MCNKQPQPQAFCPDKQNVLTKQQIMKNSVEKLTESMNRWFTVEIKEPANFRRTQHRNVALNV